MGIAIYYLQSQNPGQRIAVFWDGARYDCSQEIKEFKESLEQVNRGLEKSQWQITCTKFTPNAPEQNLVEDIWLKTKKIAIKFIHYCQYFEVV